MASILLEVEVTTSRNETTDKGGFSSLACSAYSLFLYDVEEMQVAGRK